MTQKCFFLAIVFVLCTVAFLLIPGNVMADGNQSIARVLDGPYDDFIFKGDEGQILFAEIKAEIYQNKGRMGGDHGDTGGGCSDGGSTGSCDTETTGGYSDGVTVESCDTGSSGGCSDGGSSGCSCDGGSGGGPKDICLQVIDGVGEKICWAGRPVRPGWQRDPRLACPLPEDGYYTLRVFIGQCGSTDTATYTNADSLPSVRFYKLYVELKDITEDNAEILAPNR